MNTHGFTLIKEEFVKEVDGIAKFYRHDKTNAQFLSITNKEINKCFAVNFRTPPKNSTGVAHILEHSVLCGSQKYPTREPFVQLLKSSLQTFLNAMTYPDKTCYPVASTNIMDLYNLMDVYMDAVFFPRARMEHGKDVLAQEGWHIDTSSGKWKFKGVVYNEMKGSYSSPDTIIGEKAQQAIFPDTLYRFSSGGDPKHILDLTYEEFEEFHKSYYHPSNAYFYWYGDDDEEMRLKKIDEVISKFDKIETNSAISLQKIIPEPRKVEASFEVSKMQSEQNERGHAMVSWLLTPVYEKENQLLFRILDHILIGLPGSPLRKALIDSGLGDDIKGGLGDSLIQMYYSAGLRSIKLKKENEMQDLILNVLSKLSNDGIDQKSIAAAINSIEFRLREGAFHIFSRGLMTMTECLSHWLHDKDPINALKWEDNLISIKQRLANGEKVFENLIKTYLIENQHRVLVNIVPDPELAGENIKKEEDRLQAIYDGLSEEQRQEVEKESIRLQEAQAKEDSPEAMATIPVLTLADIPKEEKSLPIEKNGKQIPIYTHDLDTRGILYAKLICSLDTLPYELLPLLNLYSRSLTEMDTKKSNYTELGLNIGAYTGGIRNSTLFQSKMFSEKTLNSFIIASRATEEKIPNLLELLEEIIFSAQFDNKERFKQILIEEKAKVERMLIPGGRTLANLRLGARFSELGVLNEYTQGVEYVKFVRNLVNNIDILWPQILKDLQTIHQHLFISKNLSLDLIADKDILEQGEKAFNPLLEKFGENNYEKTPWNYNYLFDNEAFIVPSRVNYIGLGTNLFKQDYAFQGSALVITRYLRMTYLWDRIRVIGGAYGCGLQFSKHTGSLTFASYRDPQVSKSIETFKGAAEYLGNLQLSQRDLDCAIIGTIGEIDSYMLPEAKGITALWRELTGESIELRQKIRDEVFSTKRENFHDFAKPLQKAINDANYVAFGGNNLEEYATEQNWKVEKLL